MSTKKVVILTKVLSKEHQNHGLFMEITESFGYEVITLQGLDTALEHLRDKETAAVFCDEGLFFAGFSERVDELRGIRDSPAIVLLISDSASLVRFDRRIDFALIISLPGNLFELNLFSIYKHIFYKERVRLQQGAVNPEFIKKLLSDTAHEINNILTGMQGYAELAQLNPDDRKLIEDSFQVVIDSSHRVRNEIKNMRAFARVEHPQFETVQLWEVLNESVDLLKPKIKAKGISILKNYKKGYIVEGDYEQLVQVFFNVIRDVVSNSKDKATAQITITGAHGNALVKVEGEEYRVHNDDFRSLERIFALDEPVLKADSKEGKIENRNVLSICNRIIHNHRGTISVLRRHEKGLLYTVRVPMAEAVRPPTAEYEAPIRYAYEEIGNLDMDILVVDDEEYVRNTIYYLFDKKGCRVTLAEDGEYGLRIASDKPFDLIFMDYLMPKMGGVEAARKIFEHNKDVKIVFITGRDTINENRLYKSGVYACIKKPFEMKELYEIARKVALEKGLID